MPDKARGLIMLEIIISTASTYRHPRVPSHVSTALVEVAWMTADKMGGCDHRVRGRPSDNVLFEKRPIR